MGDGLKTTSLYQHVEAVAKNFAEISSQFPDMYLAAEAVNDILDQLYTERLITDGGEDWQRESARMVFGAYSGWVYAYIMTAAGLSELGLMSARRAIEFVCYISKMKDSNERAKLWVERNESRAKRKEFGRMFAIPRAYFGEPYSHLKQLLVWHDHASDYGAHGNFSSIAMKWRTERAKSDFLMSFQDEPIRVPLSAAVEVLIGSSIVDCLLLDMRDRIRDLEAFEKRVTTMKDIVRKARLEVTDFEWQGKVPKEILDAINLGQIPDIDQYWNDLKEANAD